MTAGWAVLAGVAGVGVGLIGRRLLARIGRGAVIPAGAMECVSGVLAAAGALLAGGSPRVGVVLWAGFLAVILAAIDISRHRLPDVLTLPALPLSIVVVAGTAWISPGSGSLLHALIGGLVVGTVFLALAVASPSAMGLGDVKLVPSLGVLLGFWSWGTVVVGIVGAFVLGAVAAVAGVVTRRWGVRSALPFGPFLLAGTWLAIALPQVTAAVLDGR